MRVCRSGFSGFCAAVVVCFLIVTNLANGQASYTAQVRGVVKDQSGALVTQGTITITNDATGIAVSAHTDDHGLYILTGLRHAV